MGTHAGEQGEGAILQLHHHALQGLLRLFQRHFEQFENHRLIAAQHLTRGNTKQDGVTDLAGSTGHGNTHRLFAHDENSRID